MVKMHMDEDETFGLNLYEGPCEYALYTVNTPYWLWKVWRIGRWLERWAYKRIRGMAVEQAKPW